MTDAELMVAIQAKYGAWIDAACEGSPFPPALVAALAANESGLDEGAARFEPAVFADLALVVTGRKPAYATLGGNDLTVYLGGLVKPASIVLSLMNLATSWGPTQIMGWHAPAGGYNLSELSNLETHFRRTVSLLADFAAEFKLLPPPGVEIPGSAWDSFFRCWNSGTPTGRTFDPNYSGHGVRRLQLYEGLV